MARQHFTGNLRIAGLTSAHQAKSPQPIEEKERAHRQNDGKLQRQSC